MKHEIGWFSIITEAPSDRLNNLICIVILILERWFGDLIESTSDQLSELNLCITQSEDTSLNFSYRKRWINYYTIECAGLLLFVQSLYHHTCYPKPLQYFDIKECLDMFKCRVTSFSYHISQVLDSIFCMLVSTKYFTFI